MPITLKKRDNESNERLIRRFTRRIQTSGMLLRAKRRQYFDRPKKKNQLKKDALRRLKMRTHEEYLRKIGVLEEDSFGNNRNNRNNKKRR
jgi:ribosomal protein S21